MNFAHRINTIFLLLDCSNATMSRSCGIDPSLISRYRTGERTPHASSTQFQKLCKGIVAYAQVNSLWENLQKNCQFSECSSPELGVSSYLIPKNTIKQNNFTNKSTLYPYCFFGEKLNTLMNIMGISNIRLAKVLNVDSSLISRLRNGLRTPPKDSPLTINIANYFYKRLRSGGFDKEISELLFIPEATLVGGGEKLLKHIIDWLFDQTEVQNTRAMDNFLEMLNSFSLNTIHQLPPLESIANANLLTECTTDYIGLEGLRRGVMRFLASAAYSNQSRTLKLYSDQNMDWLTSDQIFAKKWSALMLSVILKKNPIQIIHHIDRSLPEMLAAIENWLPLYMSGMITSFYCRKSSYNRFSHTLFIAPGLAAISGSLVAGTEHCGKYHYATTDESINYEESQFDALMAVSKPLVQVFYEHHLGEHPFYVGELIPHECTTKKLLSSPSIATMSRTLLEKILIRKELSQQEKDKILLLHKLCVQQFENELDNGRVIEYTALPKKNDLLTGKVKLNLANQFSLPSISYTAEEYTQHINEIISLLKKNQHYNFSPLSHHPLENIQIILKTDLTVMVLKKNPPAVSFLFSHPMMCQAFDEYIDTMSKRNSLNIQNREELLQTLNRYNL